MMSHWWRGLFALCYRWFASEFVEIVMKWFVRLSSFVPDFQVVWLNSSLISSMFHEIWSSWLSFWTWQDWQFGSHILDILLVPTTICTAQLQLCQNLLLAAKPSVCCKDLTMITTRRHALEYCLEKWIQHKTDCLMLAHWLRWRMIAAAVAATRLGMLWILAPVMDVMDSRACNERCNSSCNGSRQHVID